MSSSKDCASIDWMLGSDGDRTRSAIDGTRRGVVSPSSVRAHAHATADIAYASPRCPPARPHGGWFESPAPLADTAFRLAIPGAGGLLLTYEVGPDDVQAHGIGYRTLDAHWQTKRRVVVARARLGLLRCAIPSVSNDTLARAVRSGHAVDLISTLTLTFQGSVASLFTRTRHVASFLDLELREDYCGKGLGWMLGLELMQVVERRYGAGLFLFRPLPLQALDGRSRARDAMHGDFRRHRYRIARAAAKYWHARKLPGSPDHMVIVGAPLAGATMVTGRTWWYLR